MSQVIPELHGIFGPGTLVILSEEDGGDGQKKKSKTGEDGSNHAAQIGLGDRGRKNSKIWIGF